MDQTGDMPPADGSDGDTSDPESPGRRIRAERIAEAVLLASEAERQDMIDSACGEDAALRRLVETLLAGPEAPTPASEAATIEATVVTTGATQQLPEMIGRYRIRRVIQSGGMGTVYEALQENPRRRVAIKVMKAGLASPSALRRFEYESQVLGKLNHPTIAEIYEAGTFDDGNGEAPYFAMEYIDGAMPLDEWARSKRLSTREKLRLFEAVCDAIHHGHQKGVVHRDLKPDNILVDSTGRPRVIDFGVARATDSDIQVATMQTDVGQLVGTLYYMSPEQCEANPDLVDTRSDVYALGVILFELLTGRRPHQLENVPVYDAARMIREDAPSRMSTLDRTLGGDLETIVGKALEKDKDRRYQSALELKQDIARFLGSEPIEARPPSILYQTTMFTRRHKALVASVSAVILVLLVTTVWSLRERGRSDRAALEATAARELATLERDRAEAANEEIASTLIQLEEQKVRADGERNRAQAESDRARLVAEFLYSIFEMASPERAQGRRFSLKELLREASGSIEATFGDQPMMEADLRGTIGRIQQDLGDLDAAEPNLQKALILLEREHGSTHPRTHEAKILLARIWTEKGRYDDAESRLESILLSVENDTDLDEPQILAANTQRAMVQMNTLRVQEAAVLMQDVVERSRRVLGANHPETMRREVMLTMANSTLARLSGTGGDIEVEPAFENSARIEAALGALHPTTLNSRLAEQLIIFFRNQRVDSLDEILEIADSLEQVRGPDHTDSLSARTFAGLFHLTSGENEIAADALMAAHQGLLKKHGRDHPETMATASLLGSALTQAKRYEEAVPLLESSWYGQKQLWGEDDIRTVQAESTWTMAMMQIGRFEESIPHFEHTMEVLPGYPISITERWMFSILLARATLELEHDRPEEADATGTRLRQLVLARDDASPSLRLTVLLELTRTLLDGGLETGGIATAKAFAELVPRLYGEDTDMEINWLGQMASSLHQEDRDRMALTFTRSMIEAAGQDAKIEADSRGKALAYHGSALRNNGRPGEAIPLLEEAIELRKGLNGEADGRALYWETELLKSLIADDQLDAARERNSELMPLAFQTMEQDDEQLNELIEIQLSMAAQDVPGEANVLFQQAIAHCEDGPACIARMVEIFLQRAPSGVRNQLHGELREQLDIALASTDGPEPDMTRVAMEMLLFELKLQEQAEVFAPEDLGETLGVKVTDLLEALDGDSSPELRTTSERIRRRLEELLGTDHDLTIATHAEILIGDGNDQAAREAFLRAAVTSEVEVRRRAYLERANRLQQRMAEDDTDAGS
jgi:tetratricopeptide (TPR) repeat protein